MMEPLCLRIVHNGLSDVLALLIVSGKVEASLRIVRFKGDLKSAGNVTEHAKKSNNTSEV